MSEFLYDWSDTSMSLDSPQHGIPIPRNQHSQPFTRPDFNSQAYLYDNDSPSPRPILVPFNSLVMNGEGGNFSSYYEYPLENQRSALSPINFSGSPLPPPSKVELDTEIKMEPFDDLLNIGPVTNPHETLHPLQEDNLLDNVNFEDLLMADNMDSSQTPCLDPQHSSPAAMAAVHPDEVFGFMRPENSYQPVHVSPSVSVPVKAENATFGAIATSFPPQGIGWKDIPLSNQSPVPTHHPQCQPLDNQLRHQQPAHQQLHRSFMKGSPQHPSRLISMGKFSPQDPQPAASTYHNRFTNSPNSTSGNNNSSEDKPLYTQLESAGTTTSALHDLLIGSPSTSLSPQQPHQLQHSPHSTGSNLSPASPFRGLSQDIPIGQSVPGAPSYLMARSSSLSSRLSSSAPVNEFSFDQIWQRREPRQHLLSTGSLAEEVGGSTSSLSTGGGILSPLPHDLSIDEGIDSDDDSEGDHYDSDSDNESIMSEEISLGGTGTKRERHFWQYNVQAKGPKGQRVNIMQRENDPHQLAKIMDPVFSPLCSIQGIKHSGKARRGDGNDLTPSPRKLVSIGIELSKLNKKINEMTPVSELPSTVRSKSRKEKNKLASRACRLKKKAQHEANKIKLYGLEQEHHGLLSLISKTKEELLKKVELVRNPNPVDLYQQLDSSPRDSFCGLGSPGTAGPSSSTSSSSSNVQLQQILSSRIESTAELRKQRIAGLTTEFVNKVIENCRNGNPSGGLDELAHTFAKASLFSLDGVTHSHISNEPQL